ncbi:AI-2E family transporter [Nocardioides pakistanensis]
MSDADDELRRTREEAAEAARAAEAADDAAEQAEESAEGAEQARDQATGAAGVAQRSATKAQRHELTAEEQSLEFLRDRLPEEGELGYGEPGQPLPRHSPFYMGFTGAAGALLAIWLGQQLLSISSVIVLIVVAMFLAIGLNPAVEFFLRRGLKRSWAVLVVTVGVVVAIALFVLAIVPVITDQVTTITDRAPDWFRQLQENRTIQDLDDRYGIVDRVQKTLEGGSWANTVFGGVIGVGLAVVSAIANTFIVIVLMLYFLASLPSIKRFAYRFAPASRRERVTYLGDQILANVGGYVSGAFLVATAAGISSLIFLMVVGLGEYAVALAVVVALLDVIPMIGATLGAVVVTAIGFATDPKIGLACLIFYLVYQQFENYVIYPRVMARSVDIPGSLIVIAALVGAGLLGVVGALLAIPTAAAVQLILKEVLLRRQDAR